MPKKSFKIATCIIMLISILSFSLSKRSFFHDTKIQNLSTITVTSMIIEDNDEMMASSSLPPGYQSGYLSLYTVPPTYVTFTVQLPAVRPAGRVEVRQGPGAALVSANIPAGNGVVGYTYEWTDYNPTGYGYLLSYFDQ